MKVIILTPQIPFSRESNDFYPLIKWRNQFKEHGIEFVFIRTPKGIGKRSGDFLWLDYRWILYDFKNRGNTKDEQLTIAMLIERWRGLYNRIFLFDSGDSSGSRCFWLTPLVDKHIKKQILKDRVRYTGIGIANLFPWMPKEMIKEDETYVPARKEDLHKLCLGWNIGLIDYRKWPFQNYWPIGRNTLLNSTYPLPRFLNIRNERPLLVSYRGGMANHPVYSYQRNKTMDIIKELVEKGLIQGFAGGKVNKNKYLKELEQSKVVVSPYGWGEVCYRDFETILFGAALVKPRMDHLETYPNIYKSNETYIPIEWDLSDLEVVLLSLSENTDKLLEIAGNGQRIYLDYLRESNVFVHHVKNLLQ